MDDRTMGLTALVTSLDGQLKTQAAAEREWREAADEIRGRPGLLAEKLSERDRQILSRCLWRGMRRGQTLMSPAGVAVRVNTLFLDESLNECVLLEPVENNRADLAFSAMKSDVETWETAHEVTRWEAVSR